MDEEEAFDRQGYENIRQKMHQLKGNHHLLRAAVNRSVAAQEKEISHLLFDK